MATDSETVADIIAEMRGDGHTGPADALEWVRIKLEHYADRLEAAHKRERGDCAKLREAVKAVVDVGYPHNFQREAPHIRGYCYDITRAIEKCFTALVTPPRNCDLYSSYGDAIRAFDELEDAEQYEDIAEWLFATTAESEVQS